MIKGAIIYNAENSKRNLWFIEQFKTKSKNFDIDLSVIICDDKDEIIRQCIENKFVFAIVRYICPSLSKALEEKGVKVFNNSGVSLIANDKFLTYTFAKKLKIPTMKTQTLEDFIKSVEQKRQEINFPCVLKSVDGHGGSEVFKVENLNQIIDKTNNYKNKKFIIQELCDTVGKDMRIYLLGNEILCCCLRTSKTDFRSNYSLGGTASLCLPTESQLKTVNKIYDELKPDLLGVDFIYDNNEWVLNEIEDIVGTRMVYSLTSIDVVSLYLERILNQIKSE